MMHPVTSKALKFDCLFFVEYFAMDLIMSFMAVGFNLVETWSGDADHDTLR